jgi:long-subunit acyl-CoA synthetase (AMP-forming)
MLLVSQFELYAADVRRLLAEEGAVRGTRIATISRNSSEFAAVAFATWGLGAVHVPIPENMTTGTVPGGPKTCERSCP